MSRTLSQSLQSQGAPVLLDPSVIHSLAQRQAGTSLEACMDPPAVGPLRSGEYPNGGAAFRIPGDGAELQVETKRSYEEEEKVRGPGPGAAGDFGLTGPASAASGLLRPYRAVGALLGSPGIGPLSLPKPELSLQRIRSLEPSGPAEVKETVLPPPSSARSQSEWEAGLVKHGLLNGTYRFAGPAFPLILSSVIRHASERDRKKPPPVSTNFNVMQDVLSRLEPSERKHRKQLGVSYAHLLNNSKKAEEDYDPFFLDDPNLKTGKHRLVMNLPGLMSSVFSFVTESDLKRELNTQFRQKHEHLPPSLTLSKIRKVKQLLLEIGRMLDLELSTVVLSYVYFERLASKGVIQKENRKLAAGVCLLLAFKFNEAIVVTGDRRKVRLRALFDTMERTLGVKKAEIQQAEFGLWVSLDFTLDVKRDHLFALYSELVNQLEEELPPAYRDYQTQLLDWQFH